MPAEAGHHPNLPYFDQATGSLHLNGTSLIDSTETTIVAQGSNGLGIKNYCRVVYDFAVDGGVIGLITPATAVALPNKAVVTNGWFHVTTLFVGATATIALGLVTTTDLLGATAIATFGSTGFHAMIPVGTAATFVASTLATQKMTMTVATAALTAGKAVFVLEYIVTL